MSLNFNLPKEVANIYWEAADLIEFSDYPYSMQGTLHAFAGNIKTYPLNQVDAYKLFIPLQDFLLNPDIRMFDATTTKIDKVCILRSVAERLMGIPVPRLRDEKVWSKKKNSEGLTFEEWSNAACSRNIKAWERGEDPTEYRNSIAGNQWASKTKGGA